MMCVASGSALSIATFGLFPLAGLDVSPVANKPAAQTQVSIVKVYSQGQCSKSDACIRYVIILCRKPFCVHTSSSCMLVLSAMAFAPVVHMCAGYHDARLEATVPALV